MTVHSFIGIITIFAGTSVGWLETRPVVDVELPPTASAALTEAAAILSSPRAGCGHQCYELCLITTEHAVIIGGDGSASGVDHDCIDTGFIPCSTFHKCGGFAQEDLARLEELLPTLQRDELRMLHEAGVGVLVNVERRSIQVFGCSDLVVMSLLATDEQLDGLTL